MNIIWNQNPFLTKIELDERDKNLLLLGYQNEEYTNLLCNLHMRLAGDLGDPPLEDIATIKSLVEDWKEICNLTVESEEIQTLISDANHQHGGDCTCWAMSCFRCRVEDFLGVDTVKGCGKHSLNAIMGAFGSKNERSIDEAIALLETPKEYVKPETWPKDMDYESHIPRWKKERAHAVSWLKAYKLEHGF